MPVEFVDPYRQYNFKLIIQGVTEGHFTECGGIEVNVDVIKYREAGNNQIVHVMPGQVRYSDVTLRYGLTSSRELWDWLMTSARGKPDRRNVSILMLDSEGTAEVMRWDLINCWPCAWRGAPLDAMSQEVAIESLTLVFESVERA